MMFDIWKHAFLDGERLPLLGWPVLRDSNGSSQEHGCEMQTNPEPDLL